MPSPKKKQKNKGKNRYKSKPKSKHRQRQGNQIKSQPQKKATTQKQSISSACINKCGNCSKLSATSRCGGCKLIFYCNKQCQLTHWPKHKKICKWQQIQNKQIKNDLFMAKTFDNNNYIQRINVLLKVYQTFIDNQCKYDKYSDLFQLISHHYPGLKIEYFVSDYAKYINNIDQHNIYKQNDGKCDLKSCHYLQREYRNRSLSIQKQCQLYHGLESEQSIVICQLLDALHIAKFHLIDLGMRYIEKDDAKMNQDEIACHMKIDLLKKRAIFSKIRNDNQSQNESKFVTQILCNVKQSPYIQYASGYRFYYHKYYKNNVGTHEQIPGAYVGCIDGGNMDVFASYSFGDWYISPQHKCMKAEFLHNINSPKGNISMFEYKLTEQKARIKLQALKGTVKGSAFEYEIVYCVGRGTPISLKHILSIMFYTNFTRLSSEFSTTFRKISKSDTDDALKKRHSVYCNWAKYLRETVDLYGLPMGDTNTKLFFFHGISHKMVFNGFQTSFKGPTSTTLQYSTAVLFASQGMEEGIVITIKNNGSSATFFDCVPWSDFSFESEMLFLGGIIPLEITGLKDVSIGTDYDGWIKTLKIFDAGFIQADSTTDKVLKQHKDLILSLINKTKEIPIYVQILFDHLLQNTKTVQINMDLLKKNTICFIKDKWNNDITRYGYKILKAIYLNGTQLKWSFIMKLFPSLQVLKVFSRVKTMDDVNSHKWAESLEINNDVLNKILTVLINVSDDNKGMRIYIFNPKNSIRSLKSLTSKHSVSFGKCNYKLEIKENHNEYEYRRPNLQSREGNCCVFSVVPIWWGLFDPRNGFK